MKMVFLAAAVASVSVSAFALDREQAELVVREYVRQASPMVREAFPEFQRDIDVEIRWEENYPSASSGTNITITGGLFRLPYMTSDAAALILCHETGHSRPLTEFHVGADKKFPGDEAMADYFASAACLGRVLKASSALRDFSGGPASPRLADRLVEKCARSFSADGERAICRRTARAALVFIEFLYREIFRADYDARGLSAPSFEREWQGKADFLQCRLAHLERGIFREPPFVCKDQD